jgi:hypothetical protein
VVGSQEQITEIVISHIVFKPHLTFYIPSGLAYGPNGPASIGPDQTLIFTVELLDITITTP